MPSIREIIPFIADRIDEQFQSDMPGYIDVVPTGINSIDGLIGGFRRGDINLLAGLPGVGKTTLATQIAAIVSGFQSKQRVIYISWRETSFHSAMRVVAYGAGNDQKKFQRGELEDSDWDKLVESFKRFEATDLVIENLSPEFEVLASTLSGLIISAQIHIALIVVEDCWGYCDDYVSAKRFLKWLKELALKNNLAVLLTCGNTQLLDNDRWGCLKDFSDLTLELVSATSSASYNRNLFVLKQRLGQPAIVSLRYNAIDLYH
jgi:KaiC/GvpD/RAD55 family RecA-like ATPase